MRRHSFFLVGLLGWGASSDALAQPSGDTIVLGPRPRLSAVRLSGTPRLDGRLDDLAWAAVSPTTAFIQKFPNESSEPSEATALRVGYDDEAIYIAFDCTQVAAPLRGRLSRRDRETESDRVEIGIDDGTNTYAFSINAAGVLSDGVRFNDTDYSSDWNGVWEGQVERNARGWAAELRIPLRILRHSQVHDLGFQARRYISYRQETVEWAFIPRAAAGEVSHYGRLQGISGVARPRPFELQPYVAAGVDWRDMRTEGPSVGELDYRVSAGLDVGWRVSRSLVLDATFNPDFGQIEADQLLLNLTTFETFTPEKRAFFVNGMELFQVPRMELFPSSQTLFYTRRIGAVPAAPVLADDDPARGASVRQIEPSTIYGAAKLGGKIGAARVGLVSSLVGRNDAALVLPDGTERERMVAPLTLASVARVRLDVADGASLGMLGTMLRRFEPVSDHPRVMSEEGELRQRCPEGATVALGARCFHDGYTLGLDGSWRSPAGTYVAAAQGVMTSIQHGPSRALPDGTTLEAGDMSGTGRLYLAKEGGQWLGSVEVERVGRRADFNDLGFLARQNQLRFVPYLAYRSLTPFWGIAEIQGHAFVAARNNLDGLALLRGYYVGVEARLQSFWSVAVDFYRYDKRFEDREVGDGTALQRPTANGVDLSLSTDPRRTIAASMFAEAVFFDGGKSISIDGEITLHAMPQLELQLLPQVVVASGESRFVEGTSAQGRYLFGELSARSLGATMRASYVFTNRLTLQLYGQMLLVAKDFSRFREVTVDPDAPRPVIQIEDLVSTEAPADNPDVSETSLNLNAVLRWELRPGSTLFLVYSRSQNPDISLEDESARLEWGALRRGPAANGLQLKISYYWN